MDKKANLKVWLVMAAILCGLACAGAAGGVIYVDDDATIGGNGQTWGTAYKYLQDALSEAGPGDEIWVAGGVYEPDESFRYPNGTGSCNATFQLKNGVVIKGGYAGFGEPDPDARDIELYETILSGDLYGDDGPDFANNGENSYHVVTGNGTNATAVLDGFTITAGNAGFGGGGGMFSYEGSPTLTNCTFSGNSAEVGGGMLSWNNSNPTLTNCTFSDNSAGWSGGGMVNWDNSNPTLTNCTFTGNSADGFGGGMLNVEYSSPTLTGCTFSDNSATWDGGGMCNWHSHPTITNCTFSDNSAGVVGGGMHNYESSPTLTDCTFSGNSAGEHGGGMHNHESSPTLTDCIFIGNSAGEAGGGMNNAFSNSTVTNCTFTGNSARHGGGILNHESSPTLTNCTFIGNSARESGGGLNNSSHSSPTVTNCMFVSNSATYVGGGMHNWYESNPTVTNCTFSRNSAYYYEGGGMCNHNSSSPTITNCILWGNTASSGPQIYKDGGSSATVSYSDVQGDWPGTGNINADPMFVGPKIGEPPEAPIAHWKFDEGQGSIAYDSAGGNHGTLMNGPQWTTGQIGGALSFDGVDDYVIKNPYNNFPATEITAEFWMKSSDTSKYGTPISYATSHSANEFLIFDYRNFRIFIGGPSTTTGVSANDGSWHHITVTWRSSDGSVKLYKDGNLAYSGSLQTGYSIVDGGSLVMAQEQDSVGGGFDSGQTFLGLLDDVRIYNRALSAEEIRQFYRMDYHLLPDSPCIDAGDNTAVPGGVTTDLDGAPRFVDDPYTVDTGNGTPPIVDMGAYEYRRPPISIYVDEDAPGPIHDGSGWADAFNHLQDALAVAISGDDIRVAEGTYMPDSNSDIPAGSGDREATFGLVNGVAIYGGYAGYGEPDPNERDVELYETVLSGDLNGDDGPDFANNGENSYNVVTGSGTNVTAVLDGFTITGGNTGSNGGGMYNNTGSPMVINCTFTGNSAGYLGGGMVNVGSSPTVTNCTFGGNSADFGGGMNNWESSPTLTNCTFSGNSAVNGGGMDNYDSSPTVTNCTFKGNSAELSGGGMVNVGNSPTLTNCTFSGNSAGGGGGGMWNVVSSPTVTNCTFSGNWAYNGGGGMANELESRPTLANCILWGNTAPSGPQIHNYDGTSWATVSYSCVQGYVEPPTQGLIAHWRFDEGGGTVAYDSAGDNHGTLENGPIWQPSGGRFGGALSFDEVDDYLEIPDFNYTNGAYEFTLCFWFKIDDVAGSLFQYMFSHGNWNTNNSLNVYLRESSASSPEQVTTNIKLNDGRSWQPNTGIALADGQWHMYAITVSSADGAEIFIDADSIGTNSSIKGSSFNPGTNIHLGSRCDYNIDRYFGNSAADDGLLDDVRIYDRALSAEEVEQLYQYGLSQGNINADPRFLDVSGGDLRLLPTSPCIDAGDNTAVPAGVTTDLGGNPRFVDQTEVPDTGNGTAPIVDMGAFEADYIQAQMKFTPKVLNPKSKAKWIKAHLVLPEGFAIGDVNTNSPARIVEPFIADSNYMEIFLNEDGLVEILAAFDHAVFCSNGSAHRDIVVIAQLTTGQYFYGTDTIRIKTNNLEYLAILTSHWLEAGCGKPDWCGDADLDQDTVVNFVDFALFDGCCIEVIEK